MRIGFDKADFEELAQAWNRFYPELYWLSAEDLKARTVDSYLFDWGASSIERDENGISAFVAIKKSAASLYRGPDPDLAHITGLAFTSPAIAVDLLASAKKLLVNRGIYKLSFGQDSLHVFPGCPIDAHNLREFLIVNGFQEGTEQYDLEYSLGQFQRRLECPDGCEIRPLVPEEVPALRAFLEREFPGRWRYDTLAKIDIEERCDFVVALLSQSQIEGFALTQDESHRLPIAGGVWRRALGSNWGTLGPIGVSKAVRGRGLGQALLQGALQDLKDRGVNRCLIDWTTLVEFYARAGFQPTRTYRAFELVLAT